MSATAVLASPDEDRPDWHLAQLLHSQGIPLADIVSRCFVSLASLRKRIQREGWVGKREELKRGLSVTISSPQAERNESTLAPLATASQNVRRMASDELLSMGHTLTGIKQPKSLQAIDSRLDVLAKLVGVARSTYGWDQQGASSVLSVQRLEGAGESKVMDIQSSPAVPEQIKEGSSVPALPDQTG